LVEQYFVFRLTNTATTRQQSRDTLQQCGLSLCERVTATRALCLPSPSLPHSSICSSTSFAHRFAYPGAKAADPARQSLRLCPTCGGPLGLPVLAPRADLSCLDVRPSRHREGCREMTYSVSLGCHPRRSLCSRPRRTVFSSSTSGERPPRIERTCLAGSPIPRGSPPRGSCAFTTAKSGCHGRRGLSGEGHPRLDGKIKEAPAPALHSRDQCQAQLVRFPRTGFHLSRD
jgi:hypothetical protein